MTALQDSIRMKPLPEWHGPTTVEGIVEMLRYTPTLGDTDRARVANWLQEPGSKYLPAHLRATLRRMV